MRKISLMLLVMCASLSFLAFNIEAAGIDEYTKLLIHSDETTLWGNGNSFNDSSDYGHNVGIYGDTDSPSSVTSPSINNYFGESILFDGDNDYLKIGNHTDFNFGTSDFTIDFWIKINDPSERGVVYNHGNDWDGSHEDDFTIEYQGHIGKGIVLRQRVDGLGGLYVSEATTWDTNWHHIAIVRYQDNLVIFKDGIAVTDEAYYPNTSVPYWASDLYIGKQNRVGYEFCLNGYLDEIRISKGIARWNQNFPLPTRPYDRCNTDYNSDGVIDSMDLEAKRYDVFFNAMEKANQEMQEWVENCWLPNKDCQ